jgi:hypothetical protein
MNAPRATIREVKGAVAERSGLTLAQLESSSRARFVAWPRQQAMCLARELTDRSLPRIGLAFGRRDHTTVLYAYRKLTRLQRSNPALARALDDLRASIIARAAERQASPTPEEVEAYTAMAAALANGPSPARASEQRWAA